MSPRPARRLAILISGRGSNMEAIVRACLAGEVAARPVVVISDRADAAGLAAARALGVPTATVAHTAAAHAAAFEERLAAALAAARPQMVALAGFMRILS